ncbi:MAG: ribbon-helix-helix protein, CopG family [Exiguobacterium profundum]|nr:MAG: ribbon-helix-helix protein, CopG family [Exiguobacterium profundum]
MIKLDEETFAQIRDRAARENTSVSHMIRLLVEWGLEAGEA